MQDMCATGYTDAMASVPPIRLLSERRFDPPRAVLTRSNGQWWRGWQSAWGLCDDGRGWRAAVEWTEQHEWGPGTHLGTVTPELECLVEQPPDHRIPERG
jgi:hypothetical protein